MPHFDRLTARDGGFAGSADAAWTALGARHLYRQTPGRGHRSDRDQSNAAKPRVGPETPLTRGDSYTGRSSRRSVARRHRAGPADLGRAVRDRECRRGDAPCPAPASHFVRGVLYADAGLARRRRARAGGAGGGESRLSRWFDVSSNNCVKRGTRRARQAARESGAAATLTSRQRAAAGVATPARARALRTMSASRPAPA